MILSAPSNSNDSVKHWSPFNMRHSPLHILSKKYRLCICYTSNPAACLVQSTLHTLSKGPGLHALCRLLGGAGRRQMATCASMEVINPH